MVDNSSMCTDNAEGVFIITRGNLRHVTPTNKDGEKWSSDWAPTVPMVSDGRGGVFIITRKNLRHCTPTSKHGNDLWSGDWDATTMCSDWNDGVFIVTRGNLRHVTPGNKDGQVWSSDWQPDVPMVSDHKGGVFIITRKNLRHCTPSSKDGSDFWSGDWDASGMCSDGQTGVFIVTRGNLRHVTASNKDGAVWSRDWEVNGICEGANYPRLYHGTQANNLDGIMSNGLFASQRGRIGSGTYFTSEFNLAKSVARFRESQSGSGQLVLIVQVNLGRATNLGRVQDYDGNWQKGSSDVGIGIHHPWAGHEEFEELCVKRGCQYDILGIICVGGTIEMYGSKVTADKVQLRFSPGQRRFKTQ